MCWTDCVQFELWGHYVFQQKTFKHIWATLPAYQIQAGIQFTTWINLNLLSQFLIISQYLSQYHSVLTVDMANFTSISWLEAQEANICPTCSVDDLTWFNSTLWRIGKKISEVRLESLRVWKRVAGLKATFHISVRLGFKIASSSWTTESKRPALWALICEALLSWCH